MHAHFRAAHHQGVAHVVAGVAHIDQLDALEGAEMFPDGEEVRQDLGGMELVGQAVEHGHAGMLCQLVHDLLTEAAILDAVIHPAKHPGGVGDGFLLADLRALGVEVGAAHAQVGGGDLEGAAGAGGGLFKNQSDVFAHQELMRDAALFLRLEHGGNVEKMFDFRRRKVQQLEKMLLFHFVLLIDVLQ